MYRMTEDLKRIKTHVVHIEERKKMFVTGVRQIGDFNEQNVVLYLQDGRLQIKGESLCLDRLDPDSGEAEINGNIASVQYTNNQPKAKSLAAKLFR